MTRLLAIDIETFSALDIKKAGGYRYAEGCELLLFGFSYDDEPVTVIDIARGEEIPRAVLYDLMRPEVLKTAYNAQFERTVLTHALRRLGMLAKDRWLDPAQWACTMVLGLTLGLPGSLAGLSEAFGLGEDEGKLSTGKRLIQRFCRPNRKGERNLPRDFPEDWAQFIEYNRRDVEAERTLRKRMWAFLPCAKERALYALDQRVNDRGVRVDLKLARHAIELDTAFRDKAMEEARRISGLSNPGSAAQLKRWLAAIEGIDAPGLTKESVPEIMARAKHASTRRLLELRLLLTKTSVKKYQAMLDTVCGDGRIHGLLQFYGAGRTGRWAGRLVQVQNLPRCSMAELSEARGLLSDAPEALPLFYENVPDALSQLVRTAFVPAPGHRFIDADFSSIEARVIAWLAGEAWRLEVFRRGGDIYCASASQMFRVPVEKHGVNGHLRQKGKIAELALGYQGGVGALKAMGAEKMGLGDFELSDIVKRWRAASPKIPALWNEVQDAAVRAIRTRSGVTVGRHIGFDCRRGMLWIRLPSGRSLAYAHPRVAKGPMGGYAIEYEGVNQTTRKWETLETYGGKLTENIVQAIARDCLAEAMLRLDAAGYAIVMHIHDEVVLEAPDGRGSLAEVTRLMARPLPWASGLPLAAEGWEDRYFRKD